MAFLERYELLDCIYDGRTVLVCRGRDRHDGSAVMLKIGKPGLGNPKRFQSEYAIIKELALDCVVSVRAVEMQGNDIALILDDVGGHTLATVLAQGIVPLPEVLRIGAEIASALGQIHHRRVIHKDVNPSNIVIDGCGHVRLLDFNISTRLPREIQSIWTPNLLEGTLTHISPEQTGRMNRAIDYRTDLYSFGVTLYTMLTGKLPFLSSEPIELIHCHIAKTALPPAEIDPSIPRVVSDIVMKLLEKMAEARYQSAFGVKADIEECRRLLDAEGRIEPFPLGRNDCSDRFQIPQKLYGREEELAALESAFRRAEGGMPELLLVTGSSGIGKSSVIQELYRSLARSRGRFVSGKFDQMKRDIPYSALLQALSELLRSTLAEPDAALTIIRQRIQRALGAGGRVLGDVLPDLERIIGPQPAVGELPAAAARNRFRLLLEGLISVFTQHGAPLAMFLDDLQWADAATLDVLSALLRNPKGGALFIIGAYRDNEVSAGHVVSSLIAELEKDGSRLTRIAIGPVSASNVTTLVQETLLISEAEARPFAELLWQRAGGNPLFVGELLTMFHKNGLIEFAPGRRRWTFDLSEIEAAPSTDNVGQLMAARAASLSERAQAILKLAAVLGNRFDLERLALVAQTSPEDARDALEDALQEGLVLSIGHGQRAVYRFIHDRVQQAVYASTPEDARIRTHHEAGEILLDKGPREEHDDWLFNVLHHLNLAESRVIDPDRRTELGRLNLAAAARAKGSGAFSAAKSHYSTGVGFLNEADWRAHHELMFLLHLGLIECEYLTNNYATADKLSELVLAQETCTDIERARLYEVLVMQNLHRGHAREALVVAEKALGILGVQLSLEPKPSELQRETAKTRRLIAGRSPSELARLPDATEPRVLLALRIMVPMSVVAFSVSPSLWAIIILRMLCLSLEHGNSPLGSAAYLGQGMMLMHRFGDYGAGDAWGRAAVDLVERFGVKSAEAQIKAVYSSTISVWRNSLTESIRLRHEAQQLALQEGDLTYYANVVGNGCVLYFFSGRALDTLRQVCVEATEIGRRFKYDWCVKQSMIFHKAAMSLQEPTPSPTELDASDPEEARFLGELKQIVASRELALHCYWASKMVTLYVLERHDEARAIGASIRETVDRGLSVNVMLVDYYYYDALLLASRDDPMGSAERQQSVRLIRGHLRRLKKWAESAPMNFRQKVLLVSAELARLAGHEREAMSHYERASEAARENAFINDEAVALEVASRFYRSCGMSDIAISYLSRARQAYARWGAHAKVVLLDQAYPGLGARAESEGRVAVSGTTTTSKAGGGSIDAPSMIKASQVLSGEISLGKLLLRLMHIVAENAGAQMCSLVLNQQGSLVVAAEFTAREGASLPERPVPLAESSSLSAAIVQYVFRTRESVMLSDALQEGTFTTDPHIVSRKCRAVLCTPLLRQGEIAGMLYLENNLVPGAFTQERAELLGVLCAQMAISIDNAHLYAELENKVIERTRELRKAQAQVIRLEKETTENQMAGGFAHEMRNALAGAQIMLTRVYQHKSDGSVWSMCVDNSVKLKELFLQMKDKIPEDRLVKVGGLFKQLNGAEEKLDSVLGGVSNALKRGLGITMSILEYAEITRDKPGSEPVLVSSLVDSLVQELADDCKSNQITIELDIAPELTILCKQAHLQIILKNLIINARDALIEAEGDGARTLSIRAHEEGVHLILSVRDTGVGIPPEVREHIFEPFFSTKPFSGMGLGLGLSRKIAALYGGEIRFESEPERGTLFQVIIPKEPSSLALS